MPLFAYGGHTPRIHPSAWIAPTASVVGDVTVEEGASVWFATVLRADFGPIVVRAGANVQDGSVVHGGPDATVIGAGATIGHGCVVHGAVIGDEALIGNGAVVLDGARIGAQALVAAGSTVVPRTEIPDRMLALGSPAFVKGPVAGHSKTWVEMNQQTYRDLGASYARSNLKLVAANWPDVTDEAATQVVVVTRLRPHPHKLQETLGVVRSLVATVRVEDRGCLRYEAHHDDDQIVIHQTWSDNEALAEHTEANTRRRVDALLADLLTEAPSVKRFRPVGPGDDSLASA
ncbi:antibiotic biosynthesis monooxygenase [Nocardioides sp. 1609]|uniref:antibiotic biosynthesis monooxygenase n=1 Tax=Nocardioides sp. 1609 TaxID=2508327 RepID=UPI001430A60C|nr:antibiotic biosynthesis monooxygenase [Nocardioides sp. 1609]